MTTINDVARAAQVSRSTVSNFLRGSYHLMSPSTQERLRQVVAALDYQPSALAQGLRSKQTRALAVLVPNIENPFFASFVRGVQDAAHQHDWMVWIGNSDGDLAEEVEFLRACRHKRVDGVVISPSRLDATMLAAQLSNQIPGVWIGPQIDVPNLDTVAIDPESASHEATSHLLSIGCRTIGFISGPRWLGRLQPRISGYLRALNEAGIDSEEAWIRDGEASFAGGYARTRGLFAAEPRLDGLIVTQSQIALGAVVALHDIGVAIPDDIAVMALDDCDAYRALVPALSGITLPQYEMGKRAGEMVLERIHSPTNLPARHVVLPHHVVMRGSTRKESVPE